MTTNTDKSKLTLYGAVYCPFVHRARVALAEADADYNYIIIDTKNKPEWYKDVYPETKIPALTDESGTTVGESIVVAEYVCERFKEKNLLSQNVMKRATSRFAANFYNEKISGDYHKFLYNFSTEGAFETYKKELNAHLYRLNRLLLEQSFTGPYFLGEQFSFADTTIAPFVIRMLIFNRRFLDGYEFEAVKQSPRLAEYFAALVDRPSVQTTFFGEEAYIAMVGTRFNIWKKGVNV
ncbi:glutathione s-transferase-like protein [Mucor ambiguus]|uniref:Glutathione s-transferase-like protein n=1 Tax=Mucor ambiguus TaxID=91626 RepID=A0A0C9MS70_9FUNG|nr:glutathione s-transferase-like protein [Mucor ambiguus]